MKRCVGLLLFVLAGNTAAAQTVTENKTDTFAEIPAAMQKFVDSGKISGAVTLVGRRGKIVELSAVGFADIDKATPMQKGTLFSIASMTKPVVATAVMILQDEGKLHVTDPVSKYLPDFESVKLRSGETTNRPITIRDLLTHTSGLAGHKPSRDRWPRYPRNSPNAHWNFNREQVGRIAPA